SHLIDIMATCIDVAGTQYPETFHNNSITPMEGISLTTAFKNKELENRPIFWEHEGNKAVRYGNFKLVAMYKEGSEYDWELYNLESDRSETVNLIAAVPEKAKELEIMWKTWAKKAGVLTWSERQPIE
ncbi:MAG: arylsulfatase A-like enzyme, partial [Arcticibacterium sp.]